MCDDVAGAVLVHRLCHAVFGDQDGAVVASMETHQNGIQTLGIHFPGQVAALHAGVLVSFGKPTRKSAYEHCQERIMPHVDGAIIIQPDKVQRWLPRTRGNPKKLLTVYIPSA